VVRWWRWRFSRRSRASGLGLIAGGIGLLCFAWGFYSVDAHDAMTAMFVGLGGNAVFEGAADAVPSRWEQASRWLRVTAAFVLVGTLLFGVIAFALIVA
jgi:hypothetical protein